MSETEFDSTKPTQEHIDMVDKYLRFMAHHLLIRGMKHDRSKLHAPEKEMFDKVTPKLKDTVYDSPEYKAHLVELGDALKHHYAHNRHHTEHWPNGIMDMDLVDIMEMFCDWCAATLRHNNGNIHTSIAINKDKYGIGEVLAQVFENTVNEYNMGKVDNA